MTDRIVMGLEMITIGVLALIPESIQDIGDEVGSAWPLFVGIMAIIELVRRSRNALSKTIKSEFAVLAAEFKPNGGSSLKDALNRIEGDVKKVKTDVHQGNVRQARIEARLGRAIAHAEAMEANSELAMFRTNERFDVEWVNESFMRVIGLPLNMILGADWGTWVHPDDIDDINRVLFRAVENKAMWTVSFRLKNQHSDEYLTCVSRAFPIMCGEDLCGFVGSLMPEGFTNLALMEKFLDLEERMKNLGDPNHFHPGPDTEDAEAERQANKDQEIQDYVDQDESLFLVPGGTIEIIQTEESPKETKESLKKKE